MIYLSEIKIENEQNKINFPFCLPLFKNGLSFSLEKPITFIAGENGTGKSILLEALATKIGFNTLGGNKNHAYKNEQITDNTLLSENIKLTWKQRTSKGFFFRAESYFNFITYLDALAKDNGKFVLQSYGGKSLQNQSHGESFLSLFENNFDNGLFILDEPESALSPEKQLSLVSLLDFLTSERNCQFIISTHSPILISCPNSEIFQICNDKLEKTDYKNTKQFQFYKDFTSCPERFLKYLFKDKN